MRINLRLLGIGFIFALSLCTTLKAHAGGGIDRAAIVKQFNPTLDKPDPQSPFSVGNGRFAFTADITGLQSFPRNYFDSGIPLETKARWAWHTRTASQPYALSDASEKYPAYSREVAFPTNMDSPAGQWLRKNPHDLPLAQVGFTLDGEALQTLPQRVSQALNLWHGELHSEFALEKNAVAVTTFASQQSDALVAQVRSGLLVKKRLAIDIRFPRGYDLAVKNTPAIVFGDVKAHSTRELVTKKHYSLFSRQVDDAAHFVAVRWQGDAHLQKISPHHWRLSSSGQKQLTFSVSFSEQKPPELALSWHREMQVNRAHWEKCWLGGGFVDVTASRDARANELQRRIILSRYLLAIQSRAHIPAQETGLTNSSWYGKHHTEMLWWHTAHWILWNQPEQAVTVLSWLQQHLPSAKSLAQQRGLEGARWAKMVGPQNRESPGGNPLIIWNQPQPIHLAELLYSVSNDEHWLLEFFELVDETAQAMASMVVWEEQLQRYSLVPPIWIAQEIYDPTKTANPTFELAYWRFGLQIAIKWRERLGKPVPKKWLHIVNNLAELPSKDNKYVAIESIPDTFDKRDSRQDHPSMLAAYGLLSDLSVDRSIMQNTLDAVLATWDWKQKIWGWDYPMIAMTAARLGNPKTAIDILLADLTHNHYLNNGHVPQAGSGLRVYLPANGALLAAVAMLAGGWAGDSGKDFPGFPSDGSWTIRAEGIAANL